MAESEGKTKAVRVALPLTDHLQLRILAAKSGGSMSQYCEELIQEAVRKGKVLKLEPRSKGGDK